MENRRQQKIAKVLKQDLAILFQRESRTMFKGAFITVTSVRITADLSYDKVYLRKLVGNLQILKFKTIQSLTLYL